MKREVGGGGERSVTQVIELRLFPEGSKESLKSHQQGSEMARCIFHKECWGTAGVRLVWRAKEVCEPLILETGCPGR